MRDKILRRGIPKYARSSRDFLFRGDLADRHEPFPVGAGAGFITNSRKLVRYSPRHNFSRTAIFEYGQELDI